MIIWGQKVNTNKQQVQSLGAIATGNVHMQVRFRTGADGASLHPLQRSGQVSAASHSMGVRHSAVGPAGLGSAEHAPAAQTIDTFPPVLQFPSGATGAFQV